MSSSRSPEPNKLGKKWHGHITKVTKYVDDQRAKAIKALIEGFNRWYRVQVKPALLVLGLPLWPPAAPTLPTQLLLEQDWAQRTGGFGQHILESPEHAATWQLQPEAAHLLLPYRDAAQPVKVLSRVRFLLWLREAAGELSILDTIQKTGAAFQKRLTGSMLIRVEVRA